MKKIFLALLILIIVGICIPAVSAELVIDESLSVYTDSSKSGIMQQIHGQSVANYANINGIYFKEIELYSDISYIGIDVPGAHGSEGVKTTNYNIGGKSGIVKIRTDHSKNYLGQITLTRFTLFPQNWDNSGLSGEAYMTLDETLYTSPASRIEDVFSMPRPDLGVITNDRIVTVSSDGYRAKMSIAAVKEWRNDLTVDKTDTSYEIELQRIIDGNVYPSIINLTKDGVVVFSNGGSDDKSLYRLISEIDKITIDTGTKTFAFDLGSISPVTPSETIVNIYIKNSQTNALIADSHIVISASVDNEFHEVINQTLPSGIYTGILQPTGGGLPNPDFYRLITTAEGYNSIMPYMDFEFDEAVTIYDYLDPIAGAPEDENNTFIDFFVRDMSANPISGATVNFGGYTLITNSAGYTIFEVDKSKTYSWTVSKSGYGSLTGNVVIGTDPRYTINTVLAPAVTPTTPTAIPTSTPISPTPTMTAPTGELVSNWLEWFAAHFGMILGGGAEIGKIFMWLCFSVPVGVYVGKEAKAGAAGFLAGAGVVTLFFVLIGWVPIWLLVLLALIIGLLYAKVFNNSDNGGGR